MHLWYEVLNEKRKLEDHKTREIVCVKRGRLDFEVVDERIETKPEKLILMIEAEPSPQVQKNEPPCRRKQRKFEGYQRWLDKCPWKTKIIKILIEDSFSKEPPRVLTLLSRRANDIKQNDA